MKKEIKNIDQLFKDSFGNFEADVNPSVWKNIEQGLQVPIADKTVRPDSVFRRLNFKNIISFAVLTGAAILAILYFVNKKSEIPVSTDVKTSQEKISPDHQAVVPEPKQILSSVPTPVVKSEKEHMERRSKSKQVTPKSAKDQISVADVDRSNEKHVSSNLSSPITVEIKDSKGDILHRQDNSQVKISSQPSQNPSPAKTIDNGHDSNANNPSGDELGNKLSDNYPSADNDNGFTFFVPDAFTPNGDGINDLFTPLGNNFKEFEMIIYDRLGNEIFRSKNMSWDGKLNSGKEAAYGIYLYVINVKDINNKSHLKKGTVTLRP